MAIIEAIPLGASFLAGHAHAAYRRAGGAHEAVLPDLLIGAHAAVTNRPLLTRDPKPHIHIHSGSHDHRPADRVSGRWASVMRLAA